MKKNIGLVLILFCLFSVSTITGNAQDVLVDEKNPTVKFTPFGSFSQLKAGKVKKGNKIEFKVKVNNYMRAPKCLIYINDNENNLETNIAKLDYVKVKRNGKLYSIEIDTTKVKCETGDTIKVGVSVKTEKVERIHYIYYKVVE